MGHWKGLPPIVPPSSFLWGNPITAFPEHVQKERPRPPRRPRQTRPPPAPAPLLAPQLPRHHRRPLHTSRSPCLPHLRKHRLLPPGWRPGRSLPSVVRCKPGVRCPHCWAPPFVQGLPLAAPPRIPPVSVVATFQTRRRVIITAWSRREEGSLPVDSDDSLGHFYHAADCHTECAFFAMFIPTCKIGRYFVRPVLSVLAAD